MLEHLHLFSAFISNIYKSCGDKNRLIRNIFELGILKFLGSIRFGCQAVAISNSLRTTQNESERNSARKNSINISP